MSCLMEDIQNMNISQGQSREQWAVPGRQEASSDSDLHVSA